MDEQVTDLKEREQETIGDTGSWTVGIILVAVGGVILFNQIGVFDFGRWWALFMLVPALFFGQRIFVDFRRHGRLTATGRRALVGGLATLIVPIIILFNLSWQILWPLMLVLGGVSILLTRD